MKNVFLIFIIAIITLSCNKDNQEQLVSEFNGTMRIKAIMSTLSPGAASIYLYNDDLQLVKMGQISSNGDTTISTTFEYKNGIIFKSIGSHDNRYYYNDSVVIDIDSGSSIIYFKDDRYKEFIHSSISNGKHFYHESIYVWDEEKSVTIKRKSFGYDDSLTDTLFITDVQNFNSNILNYYNVSPLGYLFRGNKYLQTETWDGELTEIEYGYPKKFIGNNGIVSTFEYYYD